MVYCATKVVTTAGTRVPLTTAKTMASWVSVQAKTGNAGKIFLGDVSVSSSVMGTDLAARDTYTFPQCNGSAFYDLSLIYIDAASNADGVNIMYGRL